MKKVEEMRHMKEVVSKDTETCPVTLCAYQDNWATVGTITYNNLIYSDTNNMNITGKLLDINTGNKYSHKCYF